MVLDNLKLQYLTRGGQGIVTATGEIFIVKRQALENRQIYIYNKSGDKFRIEDVEWFNPYDDDDLCCSPTIG